MNLRYFSILFAFAVLLGCSSKPPPERYGLAGGAVYFPAKGGGSDFAEPGAASRPQPLPPPWVTWDKGYDAAGGSFSASAVLRGDDYAEQKNWNLALKEYVSIKSSALSEAQRLSLTHRIAASYLGLDQASSALRVLSDYFKKQKLPVEQTDLGSSLIFAFAYGTQGDIDQSLAWFSRVRQVGGASPLSNDAARRGTQLLLSALPHDQFEALDQTWRVDAFINQSIAEERARRVRLAGNLPPSFNKHFWEAPYQTGGAAHALAPAGAGGKTIGLILPLTGRFAALGNSVKNGVELAFSTELGNGYKLSVKDDSGDAQAARVAALDLISAGDLGVIVGPLIAEGSAAVADVARDNRVPLLSFSKSSAFQSGAGIYRLGPNAESQIDSLLDECVEALGMQKFGIAYPGDDAGREFAQYFRKALQARGLAPLYDSAYLRADNESLLALSKELEALPELEALLFPGSIQSAAKVYAGLSSTARNRLKLLGTASWDNPTEIANARTALNGVIFISPFFSNSSKPVVTSFLQAYRNKYSKDPDFLAAQGYDAATLALSVLKRQAEQGGDFVAALGSLQRYEGLTGNIFIDAAGDLKRRFSVVQLLGDNLISPPQRSVPSYVQKSALPAPSGAQSGKIDNLIEDLVAHKASQKVER